MLWTRLSLCAAFAFAACSSPPGTGTAQLANHALHVSTNGKGPVIDSVSATKATTGDWMVTVTAHDPDGDVLTFDWFGAPLGGAVVGGPTMTISASALAAHEGRARVLVVVSDAAGDAAVAVVKVPPHGDCAMCAAEDAVTRVLFRDKEADTDDDAGEATEGDDGDHGEVDDHDEGDVRACLAANATCIAACPVDAATGVVDVACSNQCGLALATCLTVDKDVDTEVDD
jgi:hypothetical protein